MSELTFPFAFGKLIAAVAYFAKRELPKLDQLKTVKLLYFADREHLFRYGRPIVGDTYFCMQHGPVASFSKNVIDDTLNGSPRDRDTVLTRFVEVKQPTAAHNFATFAPKTDPDLSELSKSEIDVLDYVAAKYGQKTPWALRQLSHKDQCWIKLYGAKDASSRRVPLPYEKFFMGADAKAQAMLALVREEQKDRDLAAAFFK